jgi:hypothetical protein
MFKPVWAAIAGVTTLGFVAMSKPVHAFNVTYSFTVQVNSDAYETQGLSQGTVEQGSLTYDDAVLTGVGDEYVSPLNGKLALKFSFLNSNYTEKNDLNYGNQTFVTDYPAFLFTNRKLVGLDFFVVPSKFQPPQNELSFRIFNDAFFVGGTDNFNSGDKVGTVTYSDQAILPEPLPPSAGGGVAAVPEPSEVGGAIVASLLGVWAIKKAKRR